MPIDPRVRCRKLLEAAEGYLELDMPQQALRELSALGDTYDDGFTFERYRLCGEAFRQGKRYEHALGAYLRALRIQDDDVSVLTALAWCYKRTDRIDKAIEFAEEAYQANPREPVLLYNLACYFAVAGHREQALMWLGRALRMNSSLRGLICDESDFDSMRDDPDFQFIVTASDIVDSEP